MTRKDYLLLSAALKDSRENTGYAGADVWIDRAVYFVADALAAGNPRFDRERFLRDAGVAP